MKSIFCLIACITPPLVGVYAMAAGAQDVEPFIAYYGEHQLRVADPDGRFRSAPPVIPNYVACQKQTGISLEKALQNMCHGAKLYYKLIIPATVGDMCGYALVAGACEK
jgi:hypothetical protein